jgi:hypothetical protein
MEKHSGNQKRCNFALSILGTRKQRDERTESAQIFREKRGLAGTGHPVAMRHLRFDLRLIR